MSKIIREAFEKESAPSFGTTSEIIKKNSKGEYKNPTVEDHWQTFQEGWEAAINHLKNKKGGGYSDIVSDGGMDPR
mgnify:CR=1 FL=1|jgi:hypothetical protein